VPPFRPRNTYAVQHLIGSRRASVFPEAKRLIDKMVFCNDGASSGCRLSRPCNKCCNSCRWSPPPPFPSFHLLQLQGEVGSYTMAGVVYMPSDWSAHARSCFALHTCLACALRSSARTKQGR